MTYLGTKEFYFEVAKGNVSGHNIIHQFGSIEATANQTTWTILSRSQQYQTPTSVASLELVSDDNTNDFHPDNSANKTGAHSVKITGLDSNWDEINETVKLNGTTAVALSSSFIRVYGMQVVQSGTYASTAGASHNSTITLRVASAGAVWTKIGTDGGFGFGHSEIGAYTIPAGKTGYLLTDGIEISATNKDVDVAFFTRDNSDDIVTPYTGIMRIKEIHHNLASGTSFGSNHRTPTLTLLEKTDLGFFAKNNNNVNYECSAEFEIIIVDN